MSLVTVTDTVNSTMNTSGSAWNKRSRAMGNIQLPVIERGIELWSNPGDVVLDPFNGIASTGYQALLMGRKYIGIELKESYYNVSLKNLQSAESNSAIGQESLFEVD